MTRQLNQPAAFKFALASLALLALLAVPYGTSKSSTALSAPSSKQGETISKSTITLRVTFDSGAIGEVSQLAGQTIKYEKNGSAFGIIPYEDGNEIKAQVFRIFPSRNEMGVLVESISDVNEFKIGEQAVRISTGDWGLGIQVLKVEKEVYLKKKIVHPASQLPTN